MKKIYFVLLMFTYGVMAVPLATNFTYQGQLKVSNALANGSFDFQFTAYDTDGLLGNLGTNLATTQALAVTVVNGVFTVQLDFAGVVFQGDKVWLEVAVRNGGSTGGFQQLLPRQEVTSAPYAIQAQFVSANAITGAEIFNGSVASVDLATNSVTAGKIATDAVTSNEIVSNAITASELADGSVDTSAIQDNAVTSLKIANGTIAASDLAANSVTANAIANNAVGSSEISNNAVGASEVNSSQVQLRVNNTCEDNYVMFGINSDGSVQCRRMPIGLDYSIQSSYYIGSVGFLSSSLGISPITGFAMLSYYDINSTRLKIYICTNKSCSSRYNRTLDNSVGTGTYNSLAFRANGNPIISYYDSTNTALKVYDCNDSICSSGTARTLYSTGDAGRNTSIAVDPVTDRPIIAYRDGTALRVYACADSQCTSGLYNGIKDNSTNVGFETDIANNPITGFPQISYFDSTNGDLKFFTCSNTTCSSGSTQVVDTGGTDTVGRYSSITYSSTNTPGISYYDSTNTALKYVFCSTANCSSKTIRTLDSIDNVGSYSSAIYNPITHKIMISYYDATNSSLKVFVCSGSSCGTYGKATTLDNSGSVGKYSDMTVGSDGLPFISYGEYNSYYYKSLKVFSCGDYDCQR